MAQESACTVYVIRHEGVKKKSCRAYFKFKMLNAFTKAIIAILEPCDHVHDALSYQGLKLLTWIENYGT